MFGGGEEALGQFFALSPCGVVAGPVLLDVVAGSGHQVPCAVHVGADDLGDLRVRVVEDLAQEKGGPLVRRQVLQQYQERQ
ncbi:hypothetical protein GCM10020219_065340 [Nonomuraea dietziae]